MAAWCGMAVGGLETVYSAMIHPLFYLAGNDCLLWQNTVDDIIRPVYLNELILILLLDQEVDQGTVV